MLTRLAVAVALVIASASTASATSASKALPDDVFRIAGSTPAETAAAFALDRFVRPLPAAYLVTSATFADALAVAPIAARSDGAIFFVERDVLPAATRDALRALVPSRVVAIGGPGAISDAVLAEAAAITSTEPRRIAGATRYETAVELSERFRSLPAAFRSVFLASGTGFADALGGAAAASAEPEIPLLLTEPGTLPSVTAAEIRRLAPERVFVLGGTAAVSEEVAAAVAALGPEVVRIAGADRYETSARLADAMFGDVSELFVATGSSFADALVAGPLGLPILLVPPPDAVPPVLADAVGAVAAEVITIVGTPSVVSDAQATALGAARR